MVRAVINATGSKLQIPYCSITISSFVLVHKTLIKMRQAIEKIIVCRKSFKDRFLFYLLPTENAGI